MSNNAKAPFKNYQVRVLLIALAASKNEDVSQKCRTLLAARDLEKEIEKRAAEYGGFMSRVIEGDFIQAFAAADDLNRTALINMVLFARFSAFNDDVDEALMLYGDPTAAKPRGQIDA